MTMVMSMSTRQWWLWWQYHHSNFSFKHPRTAKGKKGFQRLPFANHQRAAAKQLNLESLTFAAHVNVSNQSYGSRWHLEKVIAAIAARWTCIILLWRRKKRHHLKSHFMWKGGEDGWNRKMKVGRGTCHQRGGKINHKVATLAAEIMVVVVFFTWVILSDSSPAHVKFGANWKGRQLEWGSTDRGARCREDAMAVDHSFRVNVAWLWQSGNAFSLRGWVAASMASASNISPHKHFKQKKKRRSLILQRHAKPSDWSIRK